MRRWRGHLCLFTALHIENTNCKLHVGWCGLRISYHETAPGLHLLHYKYLCYVVWKCALIVNVYYGNTKHTSFATFWVSQIEFSRFPLPPELITGWVTAYIQYTIYNSCAILNLVFNLERNCRGLYGTFTLLEIPEK